MLTFIGTNWTWLAILLAIACAVYGERSEKPRFWTKIVVALAGPALLVRVLHSWGVI